LYGTKKKKKRRRRSKHRYQRETAAGKETRRIGEKRNTAPSDREYQRARPRAHKKAGKFPGNGGIQGVGRVF